MTQPLDVLESSLYADDLHAVRSFYKDMLGLEEYAFEPERHLFLRCGRGMLLLFRAGHTSSVPTEVNGAPIPLHGATGTGHLAFSVNRADLAEWKRRLMEANVAIESEVNWPNGARSIYFRDPAGNSLEFATPDLWQDADSDDVRR